MNKEYYVIMYYDNIIFTFDNYQECDEMFESLKKGDFYKQDKLKMFHLIEILKGVK